MTYNQTETTMSDHEILTPEFGRDCSPDRVERLERQIDRQRTEIGALRRAAQQQRMRADAAEAELAVLREEAGR